MLNGLTFYGARITPASVKWKRNQNLLIFVWLWIAEVIYMYLPGCVWIAGCLDDGMDGWWWEAAAQWKTNMEQCTQLDPIILELMGSRYERCSIKGRYHELRLTLAMDIECKFQ